jgi:hypothetical protein
LADDCILLEAFDGQVLESSMFPVASEISSKLFYPDNFAPLTYDLAEMGEVKNFHGCDLLLICKQSETPESKKFMDFFLTHLLPSLS